MSSEGIKLDHEVISQTIKKEGKYTEPEILLKKWESDTAESLMFVGEIKKQKLPFLGILNGYLERDGFGVQDLKNGDKYFGYFDENQKEKHGIYMFKPEEDGEKIKSEFYYGSWKDDQINERGTYLWLTEDKKKKPFTDFDASSFDLYVGKFKDGVFDKGTFMTKKEDDYYVYHGDFDKSGNQKTEKGFLYSATQELLLFGKFDKNVFVSGYVANFDDEGKIKDIAKYEDKKTIPMEQINEEERNKNGQIMETFRNVILGKDYFGDAYNQFNKVLTFLEKQMNNVDIFNSDNYLDILSVTAAYNKMLIFNDITKLVEY